MGALTALAGLSVLVALLAAGIYQAQLHTFIILAYGIGRTVEPLSSFPQYSCRRIEDPRLKACEDMWLSERTRQLFLGCSDSKSREGWLPQIGLKNISALNKDEAMIALDIDSPNGDSFNYRVLKTPGFKGVNGDGTLYPMGFAGHDDLNGDIRLWIINNQPPVDSVTGEYLDVSVTGLNSTIELFHWTPSNTEVLEHVRTWHFPQIKTPNRPAPRILEDKNDFWVTNSAGTGPVGWRRTASPFLATGDVTMCRLKGCWPVAEGLRAPNGLVKGADDLIYVPSSTTGVIDVFEHIPGKPFKPVAKIETGYSLDNLSVDKNGDIWAAAMPISIQILDGFKDTLNSRAATTALKITKKEDGTYQVDKVLEDRDGYVLPSTTTVVHDATTGRIFFSGVWSPFISVCEKKE